MQSDRCNPSIRKKNQLHTPYFLMFPIIYIEKEIQEHPRVLNICQKYPNTPKVICENYGEIFNRKSQDFRLQKKKPSLILANKFKNWLLSIPQNHGIGGKHNFYFSHMLNCIYDCRYCFLQGMYASAHYVLFINYEDFLQAISQKIAENPHEEIYFFSGYDCDSLAMEQLTHFTQSFIPFFAEHAKAFLELRTKSINIQALLKQKSLPNCITAFSLTPEPISQALEHKTPPIQKRLQAMQRLEAHGWPLGLRFDPLIYCIHYKKFYEELFKDVFSKINPLKLHSVSLGPFRLPKGIFKNIVNLYPDEKLFSHRLDETKATVSYHKELETEMIHFCTNELLKYIPKNILFPCEVE